MLKIMNFAICDDSQIFTASLLPTLILKLNWSSSMNADICDDEFIYFCSLGCLRNASSGDGTGRQLAIYLSVPKSALLIMFKL